MLTGVHLLLTYRCTHQCDHCFVFGSPRGRGAFTAARVRSALEQAADVGTVEWVYFEGGEPFLHYPLLVAGLEAARAGGFRTGVVTNAYWAESDEDAEMWLRPLADAGVADLSVSDDAFHRDPADERRAQRALAAATRLGIPASAIAIAQPSEGEGVRYRGRAAEKLVEGRPREAWETFTECPDEDLASPSRVHLDGEGNVHLCQGVLLGNAWETPLAELLASYEPATHPILGPLLEGGPAALARHPAAAPVRDHVSACHLCFETRRQLRDRFPRHLGPAQVYGEP